MEQLTIRNIISKVHDGSIRIPSFQRGFVWEPDKVAYFMDSLYKEYPVGALLIWRTKERLRADRTLGQFSLPDPKEEYPIDYVLDGQQRITSIFSVFQTFLSPASETNWLDIFYVIGSNPSSPQPCFEAIAAGDVDDSRHFPLNVIFDPVKYRNTVARFDDTTAREIDNLYGIFQGISIPVQIMNTDDKANVAIVFERINRQGVRLDPFQLLIAWGWSTEFDLQEQLSGLYDDLDNFGFGNLDDNKELLMKCFTGYIMNNTLPDAVAQLNGPVIRDQLHIYDLKYISIKSSSVIYFRSRSRTRRYTKTRKSQGVPSYISNQLFEIIR